MPGGTSWLPLERVKEADAVLGDLRWLEGLRAVFTRARKEGVPTILDGDLGAREALGGILKLTDYAIFSAPALREFAPGGTDEERLAHVLSLGPLHAGVTLGARGLYLAGARRPWPRARLQRERHRHDGRRRCLPWCLRADAGRRTLVAGARAHRHRCGRAQVHAARLASRIADPRPSSMPSSRHTSG